MNYSRKGAKAQRKTQSLLSGLPLRLCAFAGVTVLLFHVSAQEQRKAPAAKNDITYSKQVVTPHIAWATKLQQGPLKSFFIPSIQYGRDMVELMQRIDLDPTTDSIDRNWDINCWGIGDYYGHEYRGDRDDFQTVYGYVEKD